MNSYRIESADGSVISIFIKDGSIVIDVRKTFYSFTLTVNKDIAEQMAETLQALSERLEPKV